MNFWAQFKLSHKLLAGLLLASFAFYAFIADSIFHRYPFCLDDFNYLTQAKIFASGRTYADVSNLPGELREQLMVWQDGKAFTKFSPGYPLLLAPFAAINIAWLFNPLISTISLLLLFLIGRTLAREREALLLVLLVAVNPYFFGYAASYLCQPLCLLLCLAAVSAFWNYRKTGNSKSLVGFSIAVGYLLFTRSLDALCLFIPCAIGIFARAWQDRKIKTAILCLSPLVFFLAALLLFNHHLTGHFAIAPYQAFTQDFRVSPKATETLWETLERIASQYGENFSADLPDLLFNRYLVYAGVILPVLAVLGAIFGTHSKLNRVLLGHLMFVVLLYNFVPGKGWPLYGARYYYPTFGSLSLLALAAINQLSTQARWVDETKNRVAQISLGICVVLILLYEVHFTLDRVHEYKVRFDYALALSRDLDERCPKDTIAVLSSPGLTPIFVVAGGFKLADPPFVQWRDLKRNFPYTGNDHSLKVIDEVEFSAVKGRFPERRRCDHNFKEVLKNIRHSVN